MAVIIFLFSLIQGATPGPAHSETVSGFYFADSAKKPEEITQPLAGALIGLYDSANDLMVDYTYSSDSGRFTLKAPDHSGWFYVVATKDTLSTRRDFEWGPQQAILLMMRRTKPPLGIGAFVTWAWGKFDYAITSFLGFALGLAYKWYQDRKKARKLVTIQTGGIKASVGRVVGLYGSLAQALQEYDASTGRQTAVIGERCRSLLSEINKALGEVSALAEKTDLETLHDAYRTHGTDSYAEFKEALKSATSYVDANPDTILSLPEEQRVERAKLFETLRNSAFLKY